MKFSPWYVPELKLQFSSCYSPIGANDTKQTLAPDQMPAFPNWSIMVAGGWAGTIPLARTQQHERQQRGEGKTCRHKKSAGRMQ
jgi:hypothetical protein